ncbi:MAG TPA: GNAT family N-acetyltransferase [Phaeodactylibacter sp.]|nr:GNAT family N-acetyltransferase [Phaeodactylibacter sp.]
MSFSTRNLTLKDGSTFHIREATPQDASRMIDMVKEILGTSEYTLTQVEEFSYTIVQEEQYIQKHLSSENCLFLVAEQEGHLIGNVIFTNGSKRRDAHQGEFSMGIIQSHRNKGVGTALLEALLDWAVENPNIKKVKLRVAMLNYPAIRLYRNYGFIEEGRLLREFKMDDGDYIDVFSLYKFV